MTTDEIISRCYEHGQPDYVLAADRLKELQAHIAALAPLPAVAAEAVPVAHRWRPRGSVNWIYDPHPGWLAEHKDEIDHEPLYASPPLRGEREAIARTIGGDIFGSPDSAVGPATQAARQSALAKADAILSLQSSPAALSDTSGDGGGR